MILKKKIVIIIVFVILIIVGICILIYRNYKAEIIFGNDYCKESIYYYDNPQKTDTDFNKSECYSILEYREYTDENHHRAIDCGITIHKCKLCGKEDEGPVGWKHVLCNDCAEKTHRCSSCGKRLAEN